MYLKTKIMGSQAFLPRLNLLGFLLHAGFPIHASSFNARQLPLSAQVSKKAFLFHPKGSHFHALTLCNFGGIHGSIFQEALGSQAFSGLFFRASHFECLMYPLDTRLTPDSLGKSMGVVALKAHYRSFPLSPVFTLFPQTFLDHPLRGADLSWRFPVLSYGDLRLGLHLPTKDSSFNRLPAISVTFSAAEGRATSPIWPLKNLAYPPRFMATGSAKAAPQTDSSSSERADSPLQSQGTNNASILRSEPETRPLQEALDRNHGIRTERADRDEEQNGSGLVDGHHALTGSPPEVTSSRKIKAIEELIRSIQELCASLALKRLEGGFTEDRSIIMEEIGEEGLLSLFTPFEKETLTAEEIWQALNTQQSNSATLFQALACYGDEGVWYRLIVFSNETGKQPQFFESFTNPTGGAPLSPLRLLSERKFTENFWISLVCLANPDNTKKLWEALIKEEGSDKSAPLYWLARNGLKNTPATVIQFAKEIGVRQQLWEALIKEGGTDKSTPLYWLARNGFVIELSHIVDLAKEIGIQPQLWEALSKEERSDKSTPLCWLALSGSVTALRGLIKLAKGIGIEQQLWETLIKAGGSNETTPLYWLDRYKFETNQILSSLHPSRRIEDEERLWEASIKAGGKEDESTALCYWLTDYTSEVTLTQLIDFSKEIGTQNQLWEALTKEEGSDKTPPLYWVARYGGGSSLTQLIHFAQGLGTEIQLWQSLIKPVGKFRTPPLYWLIAFEPTETRLTELTNFAKAIGAQKQLSESLMKAGGSNQKSTPIYWLARNESETVGMWTQIIDFSKKTETQKQLWESLVEEDHSDKTTPLYWLSRSRRYGGGGILKQLIHFAQGLGTQTQLWQSLITMQGDDKLTPLYWLTRNGGEGILTQLIHFAQGVGGTKQLWKGLITEEGSKATPLYWLTQRGGEGALTQLIHFAQKTGNQNQLWEGLITVQRFDKTTPLCWLPRNGGEGALTQLIHFAEELGTREQLWQSLITVQGLDKATPLYRMTQYGGRETLTQLINIAQGAGTQEQLWQSLITVQGLDKATPLYRMTQYGGRETLTQLINIAQGAGTQEQLWQSLITVQGGDKLTPLYWLIQNRGEGALTQLIHFAQGAGTQAQLWQSLITVQGHDKTTPLYRLTQYGGEGILTQLIHFARGLGAQAQLWEALIKEERSDKTTPLYWLAWNGGEDILTQLIHFAQGLGTQGQLWQSLITVQGYDKTTPLYRLLIQKGGGGALTELIRFAQGTGHENQLWEGLITVQGKDKTTPLYWRVKDGGEETLTQLIHFAQKTGNQNQLWEGLITVQGDDKTTPLYSRVKDGGEETLPQLIHFAQKTGNENQLWEGLITVQGNDKISPLYRLLTPYGREGALTQLIHFAQKTGNQNQLWEGLITVQGYDETTPLYWLTKNGETTPFYWLTKDGEKGSLTQLIHFAQETGTQNQLWEGLLKACSSSAHPLDGAEMSWTNLIELAGNSEAQQLWEGLTKAVNHFRTIPLYWFAQMWAETPWTKIIELVKEKHQVKLCSALDLLVKLQVAGDLSALLPPKDPPREQGRQQLTQQERLLREEEEILFRGQARMARELDSITPRYDAFIDAILALPPMQASPMLDGAGFNFYFHYDSLNEGTIPYGALEMLLRLALNPGASDQIRDKVLKIHNIHAQHHKTLEETLPSQKDTREVSQKADQGMLHGALKAITGCDPVVACLYGNLSKRGKLWPTLIELLNLKLPQRSLEMNDYTERSSLYQSIATQRPYFGESLRKLLGDSFNMIEAPSQISEAQTASTEGPLV